MIKAHNYLGVILFALLCVGMIQAQAADTGEQRFALADHGSLLLKVPTSWKGDQEQEVDRLLPTIVFTSTAGASFGVVLTPVWPTEKNAPNPDRKALQRLVQDAAEAVKSMAVEKALEGSEFEGASGVGYYFSVTDPASKPGEYKHLTQGILPVGSLMVPFTIYTNDGQQDIVADALAMLKSANHLNDKAN